MTSRALTTRGRFVLRMLTAAILAAAVGLVQVRAGEAPEHWHLMYAVARVAGLSPNDARLLADASWAVDQNEDTVATGHMDELKGWSKDSIARELRGKASRQDTLENSVYDDQGRLIAQGALLHALSSDASRDAVRKLFPAYIQQQVNAQPGRRDRQLELALVGMYLHYIVDSYVHPHFAIPGHALQNHQPDRAPNNVEGFTDAAVDVYKLLTTTDLLSGIPREDRSKLLDRYSLDASLDYRKKIFFRDTVKTIADAYPPRNHSEGIPLADLTHVSDALDAWWSPAVAPYVADSSLGDQYRDPHPDEVTRALVTYRSGHGQLVVAIPGVPRTWRLMSFGEFIRHDRNDGLNAQRKAVHENLLAQADLASRTVSNTVYTAVPPVAAYVGARALTDAALTVIVGGSGASAERTAPPPRPSLTPSGKTPLGAKDVTRRVVVEVRDRGWATDGLEKYLKPSDTPNQPATTKIVVHSQGKALTPAVAASIANAVKQAPQTTVIIETAHHQPPTAESTKNVAEIARYAAERYTVVQPQAPRAIYAEGSGADVFGVLTAAPAAPQLFERQVAVSPIQSPGALPRDVTVMLPSDTMFMNFGPGSRGYQTLNARAQQYAAGHDVVIVPSAAAGSVPSNTVMPVQYYARGSADRLELTNSSPVSVVALAQSAKGNAERAVQQILRSEQLEKPAIVGGISLVTSAILPLDPKDITGATYDQTTRRILLHTKSIPWRLPQTDAELTRIAYDCLYGVGLAPQLSIGVNPTPEHATATFAGLQHVFYVSAIEGTELGRIMFDADHLLGQLAFGDSDTITSLGLTPLNLHTMPELFPDGYTTTGSSHRGGGRVYLVPSRVVLAVGRPGELVFGDTAFDVRFEPFGAPEEAFSRSIADHWNDILRSRGGAPFLRLLEAARVVAVMNWLERHLIPFDDSLARVTLRRVATRTDVEGSSPVPPESLHPTLPLTRFGPYGVQRIIGADRRETTISYVSGRIDAVHRRDGAALRIYWNDVGEPAAIQESASPFGAAFFREDRTGRTALADVVQLKLDGARYLGFEHTKRSRYLFEVVPESVLSTIVANFIAAVEEPEPQPSRFPVTIVLIVAAFTAVAAMLVRAGSRALRT